MFAIFIPSYFFIQHLLTVYIIPNAFKNNPGNCSVPVNMKETKQIEEAENK